MTAVIAEQFSVTVGTQTLLPPTDLRADQGLVAISGESGSGKSTLLHALCGLLPEGAAASGRLRVAGVDPLTLGKGVRRWRAGTLAYVSQDPGSALNPLLPVRRLVTELAPGVAAKGLLERVGLDAAHLDRRIGELSGGQQRRIALARAIAREPELLILDEPLTGLDPRTRDSLADLVRQLATAPGRTVLLTSHDERVLERLGGSRLHLGGQTRPPVRPAGRSSQRDVRFAASGLTARHGRDPILTDAHLGLPGGGLTALVGPSGCGKTTLVRTLAGLHPRATGRLILDGAELPLPIGRRPRALRSQVALVAQDPRAVLNPHRRVHAILARPLRRTGLRGEALGTAVTAALAEVGLGPESAARLPAELSGGQRQRVALARALAHQPAVLLADEVTSALDPSTAESILDLLRELADRRGIAVLLVTHDDSVVHRCDQVIRLE